jgi:hypothetical protein
MSRVFAACVPRMAFQLMLATVIGVGLLPLPSFELPRWVRPEDRRALQM